MAIDRYAADSGIVGAGGAGFPTHVKLDAKADTVIINGAECEPLLRVDQQLMARRAAHVLKALDLIAEQVGARRGVVALKAHYHDAVASLTRELVSYPRLELFTTGSFYPAGDEQVLVTEVTGRVVPEGGIPLQVGVVVCNVETALNVYEAHTFGEPVTEKYVTVTGSVRRPMTVRVPLGITVGEMLALAGGSQTDDYAVINGGPMMGKIVPRESVITKTTKGLIVLPTGHPLLTSLHRPLERTIKDAAIACMQCSLCTDVCPRANLGHRIYPHKLMRLAAYGSVCDKYDTPMNAFLCCGCRLCEYACVMALQPWKLNAALKSNLAKKGVHNALNNKPERPEIFRETRRYPVHKLIRQLGLDQYDVPAPLSDTQYHASCVTLPLQQHVGAPSEPIVGVDEHVEKGALIARIPEGKLGANLHASISGTVTAVDGENIVIKR